MKIDMERWIDNKWNVYRAKLLWYLLVSKRFAISNALSEVHCIDAALNESRTLCLRQSEILIDMSVYQFSESDISRAKLLYERLVKNDYGLDVVDAVVAINEGRNNLL